MNSRKKFVVSLAAFAIVVSFSGTACRQNEPEWDPAPVSDTEYCDAACQHIGPEGLRCEEGEPIAMTQAGCDSGVDEVNCVSCAKFCEDTQSNGVWLAPRCVMNVRSCEEIDSCAETKKK